MRNVIVCILFGGVLASCGTEGPPVPLHPESPSAEVIQDGTEALDRQ